MGVGISEFLRSTSLARRWTLLLMRLDLCSSTRGLDASTALEFVQALRIATDTMRLATVVSIYQAGESLYEHFDKVCVIYEGRMAYFGPADKAKQYFMDMGYASPLPPLPIIAVPNNNRAGTNPRTAKPPPTSSSPSPTLARASPSRALRASRGPRTSLRSILRTRSLAGRMWRR